MAQQLIPDFRDIKDSESLARIEQYLAKLQRQLKYQFAHIDEGNIQDGAITEKKLTEALSRKIADTYGNSSEFSQTASKIKMQVENLQLGASSFEMTVDGIETRVSNVEGDVSTLEQTASSFGTRITNAEGDISTIDQTVDEISSTVSSHTGQISAIDQKADNISLAVSQEKVWRAATETALNTALSAAGITKAAGLLWYDTTNNVVKRWTGTAWANTFVNTSQIVIDDDSIDIGTTGTLNMQAGGKIKMSSASSIEIGGSPFSVGGTNLWANTNFANGYAEWVKNVGTETVSLYGAALSITIPQATPNAGIYRQITGLEVGVPYTFSCVLNVGWASILYASTGAVVQVPWTGASKKYSLTFTPASSTAYLYILGTINNDAPYVIYANKIKVEKGTVATDWSPSPSDPANAVKAAGIEIGPGIMRQYADLDWSMTAGSGASEIGMANQRADGVFVWGGGSPADAKFKAMMSGDVYAKNFYLANSTLANAVPHVMTIPRVIMYDASGNHAIHIPIIADFIGIESVKFFIPYIYAYRYFNFSTGSGDVISPTGAFTASIVDGDTAVSQSYVAGGGPYDITSRLTKASGKITRDTHTLALTASGAMNTLVIVYIKGYISAPSGTLY